MSGLHIYIFLARQNKPSKKFIKLQWYKEDCLFLILYENKVFEFIVLSYF